MRVSEIRVNQIRVNQGLGVHRYLVESKILNHLNFDNFMRPNPFTCHVLSMF